MTAEESLKNGNLEEAKAQLQEQVRREPANPKHRIFLFQLLAILGEWERAVTQLDVLADMDASSLAMARIYREAVQCEKLRTDVFLGRRSPLIVGEPDPWVALVIEAMRLTAEGHVAQAGEMRGNAFEQAPAAAGAIDGEPFEWVADADPRLGPVLELIMTGRYYWAPFHRIAELHLEPPSDLRDFVWAPAQIRWANGGEAVGFVPARYTGSESSPDPRIRLGRRTEWEDLGGDTVRGLGQRMFATDRGEYALFDVREIRVEGAPLPPASGTGAA